MRALCARCAGVSRLRPRTTTCPFVRRAHSVWAVWEGKGPVRRRRRCDAGYARASALARTMAQIGSLDVTTNHMQHTGQDDNSEGCENRQKNPKSRPCGSRISHMNPVGRAVRELCRRLFASWSPLCLWSRPAAAHRVQCLLRVRLTQGPGASGVSSLEHRLMR